MSLYRNILKQSAQTVWRYKFLWFFGFFAAFLGGFGEYEILVNRTGTQFAQNLLIKIQKLQELNVFSGEFWSNVMKAFQASPVSTVIIVVVALILLALFVFLVWLSVVSQAGLISSSGQLIKSKKDSSKLNISKGVETGTHYFWPVLGLNILSKILIYLVFFCLSLVFLFLALGGNQILINIIYIILFVIFIPVALVVAFILKYAICYVVIENKSFVKSIEDGWKLFLGNWLITLEMALILFVITFVATIALIIISLVIAVPIYLFIYLLLYMGYSGFSFWIVVGGTLLLAVFMAVAGSILISFRISSWTALFIKLTSEKSNLSKIVRWTSKIKK